jgi:glutamyl-tRNA synthetase
MSSVENEKVRVRFAPSPTGWLHIGGVRTSLFNYLFARKVGGKFLIRIEDTDTERSEKQYTDDILASLKWFGMQADEEILYQSNRGPVYKKIAEDMISKGLAYRCFCTLEEVEATREKMTKEGRKPMYARTCRDKNYAADAGPSGRTSFAIRAKFPLHGITKFKDMVRGEISFPNVDLDDFVMIRSNGVPTYNFVVVVDDIEMKISHVIRGDDHINNTPKQVFIYDCLKAELPLFAHLPMILGQDKKKLSKRTGDMSTGVYRNEGFLSEGLLNFLVRLGWSHGDQEVFTMDEMIQAFDFEHVQVAGAVFNPEKLLWINGEHIKKASPERLLAILKEDFKFTYSGVSDTYVHSLITHLQPKIKLLKELPDQLKTLCVPGAVKVDASDLKWNKVLPQKVKIKEAIQELLKDCSAMIAKHGKPTLGECGIGHDEINAKMHDLGEKYGLKLGEFTSPMRLFVTGQANCNIGLFDLLPIMPWESVAARLTACLQA